MLMMPQQGYALRPIASVNSSSVFVVDVERQDMHQLTDGGTWLFQWSPDGERIAFLAEQAGVELADFYDSLAKDIYIVDKNGDNLERLTDESKGYWGPTFSPNGRYIAFTERTRCRSYTGGCETLYIMNLEERTVHEVYSENPDILPYAWRPQPITTEAQ